MGVPSGLGADSVTVDRRTSAIPSPNPWPCPIPDCASARAVDRGGATVRAAQPRRRWHRDRVIGCAVHPAIDRRRQGCQVVSDGVEFLVEPPQLLEFAPQCADLLFVEGGKRLEHPHAGLLELVEQFLLHQAELVGQGGQNGLRFGRTIRQARSRPRRPSAGIDTVGGLTAGGGIGGRVATARANRRGGGARPGAAEHSIGSTVRGAAEADQRVPDPQLVAILHPPVPHTSAVDRDASQPQQVDDPDPS